MSAAAATALRSLRRDLAIAHRLVASYGMDELHWNHISARVAPGEDAYLVTPGNKHFACMTPDDLVRLDDNGGAQGDGGLQNVTADVIHGAIYRARPDVHAICHVHTQSAMYVSCLEGDSPLKFYTQDGGGFFGKVGWHEFEGVATDHDEQERIHVDMTTRTPEGHLPDVLMMRQHGATCCGSTVGEAFVKNFYLDRICRVQMNIDQSTHPGAKAAKEVHPDILKKMERQYARHDVRHGCEWPAMVEYAEQFLGCDAF